jgi:tRNA pseudouridine38-40 synthase
MTRHILLLVQFDGTGFHGWQQQEGLRTVQESLGDAFFAVTKERPVFRASSRTDAGVHARGLPVLFETQTQIPLRGILRAINTHLAGDVAVVDVAEVDPEFHVRQNAAGKSYRYTIWNDEARAPLMARFCWHLRTPLDAAAMHQSAQAWIGEHDFSSFRAADCQSKSTIRRITAVNVERHHKQVEVVVQGNAFLQHMVRIMVGTLTEVGRGFRPVEWTTEVLNAKSRPVAGPTAPSHGLCLEKVIYEPSPFDGNGSQT